MAALGLCHCLLELGRRQRGREVEERARRGGNRDALESARLVLQQAADAVHADTRTALDLSCGNGDVERGRGGWVGKQAPKPGCPSVTQHGSRATDEHRRHLSGVKTGDRAHGVDPAMDSTQPTGLDAAVDGSRLKAELDELGPSHNAVLASSECADRSDRILSEDTIVLTIPCDATLD